MNTAVRSREAVQRARRGVLMSQALAESGTGGPVELDGGERLQILDALITSIAGTYAHLPAKRAAYASDPVQALTLLRRRAADLSDTEFNRAVSAIVTGLRDAHTRYIGPSTLRDRVAMLPFLVEQYGPEPRPRYLVSKINTDAVEDPEFQPGVELEAWNGTPFTRAVENHADLETGGRPDSRRSRALESLTFRALEYGPPPDEHWVIVPPPDVADHLDSVPSYAAHQGLFWYDWGPVFYRGRLDRSARLLCIASDPGPTERIAGRTLVGDAGQRVQGFLSKLGLTRSYVCVNAYAYALLPSRSMSAIPILSEPEQQSWRNELLSMIVGPELQAVATFGLQARIAVELWSNAPPVMIKKVPHPSSRDATKLITEWRSAVTDLRTVVTPDPEGDNSGPNYGSRFSESDYAPIPRGDLPYGVPSWLGDDSRGRQSRPKRRNTVERDPADLMHTLIWRAPTE